LRWRTNFKERTMSGEREKILAMVEEGRISAEEANELLEALEEDNGGQSPDFTWPDLPARGEAWRQPFNASLLGAISGVVVLLSTRNARGLLRLLRTLILWPVTIFAALAAAITYFSKDSPWLHVRVQSRNNPEFKISVPFPAPALNKALQVARSRAPNAEVQEKIDAAAEILAEMDSTDLKDPLVIDISDEGDSVQIYLN
jgi:hypothetical protein